MNRRGLLAVLAAVVVLAAINLAIRDKERHLASAETVYLALAPVDPRSLMQGDYMALNYQVANEIRSALAGQGEDRFDTRALDGHVVVRLDETGVGHYQRLDEGGNLAPNERRVQFRLRAGQLKFASNAWFFEEGTAEDYEPAAYGQLALNEAGEVLLVGLVDAGMRPLPRADDAT